MVDWTSSMEQTFEYYIVDPGTWKDTKRLTTVKSSSIDRDLESPTLGFATIDVTELLDECYVRIYLVTIQNGVKERHALGTFIVQTPLSSFDGKVHTLTMDAYTPLIELKETLTPIGYSRMENENIMDAAYRITKEHVRAPVIATSCPDVLSGNFVSNVDDSWLIFVTDLIACAKYTFEIDELGRILFSPKQDTASLQHVWTYTDDNSSILYSDVSVNRDLYGIPNVVEVVYSDGVKTFYARAVNDDPNSPISTVNRGREIVYRDSEPNIGTPTQAQIDEYAEQLLRELSTVEYTVTYTHAYCPVRLGDCVRIHYSRAGLKNIKAKVISQSIKCEPGCSVKETAVFTTKLWR